jgi:hypothetical protein
MYLEKAEIEDIKMAEGWQTDAIPIIIFVRTSIDFSYRFTYQLTLIDRFVLCRNGPITCRDSPRAQAKPAGNYQLLPREYL